MRYAYRRPGEAAGAGGTRTSHLIASARRRTAPAAFDLEATLGTEQTAVAKEVGQQLLRQLAEIAAE